MTPSVGKDISDIVTSIYNWLKVDSRRLPASDVMDIINMARMEISTKFKLGYSEKIWQFTTTADLNSYALPHDFGVPFTFWYWDTDNNRRVFLKYRSYDDFLSRDPTSDADDLIEQPATPGAPAEYSYWGGVLYLRPTPGIAVALNFDYFAESLEMTDTGEYDRMSMYAWNILLLKCLEYANLFGIEDARAGTFGAKANSLHQDLYRAYKRARSNARIPQAKEYGSYGGTGRLPSYWWYFYF